MAITWTSWPAPPAWAPLGALPQWLQSGGSAANWRRTATPSVGRQIVVCLLVVFFMLFVCLWLSVCCWYSPFSVSHFCNTAELTTACRNADPWYGKKWTCFDALHVYKNRQVLYVWRTGQFSTTVSLNVLHVYKNRKFMHVFKYISSAHVKEQHSSALQVSGLCIPLQTGQVCIGISL